MTDKNLEKLNELFVALKERELNPEWDEEEVGNILFYTGCYGADYEASISAAGAYSVRKEVPFEEPEYYCFETIEAVISFAFEPAKHAITEKEYRGIIRACGVLCDFCECGTEYCEACQVSRLNNDAYADALKLGYEKM